MDLQDTSQVRVLHLFQCPSLGLGPPESNDKDSIPVGHPYAWVVQHHSTFNPPEFLTHPLSILLEHWNQQDALRLKQQKSVPRVTFQDDIEAEANYPDKSINITDEQKLNQSNDSVDVIDKLKGYVTSKLPESLPATCSRQHRHKWRTRNAGGEEGEAVLRGGGNIKALCCKGVLYR